MKHLLTLLFIGLTSLYAQTVPSYVPTNGLVGWWPFNGNANDESVIGNNGIVNGATLTMDRYGIPNSAFDFNGSNSTINCSNPSIPQNSSFSISFWINPSSVSGVQEFFHQNVWPGAFYVGINGGNMRCGDYWQNTGVSINALQWQHFIIVRNYMNNVEIYLNGTLYTSLGTDITLGGNATNPLVFGKQYGSNAEYYNGILDDIGIWNRALTHQEIQALFYGCSDSVQSQPQNFTAYTIPGWANFKCKSTDTSATYQWQQSNGAGWSNLSNLGSYSGANSDSLVITGVTASMNNYGYRCIVTGCTTDTSDVAVLTVVNGIGLGESTLDKLTISPNPTNGFVSLNTSVVGNYELLTLDGRILESGTAKKDYDLTTYPKGVYHLRLSTDEGTRVLKVVKN